MVFCYKFVKFFPRLNSYHKLIIRICAYQNGNTVFTPKELASYAGKRAAEFIYLLKNIKSVDFIYSETLNLFLIKGDGTEASRAQNYIDALPDKIGQCKLTYYAEEGARITGLPAEIIKAKIEKSYQLSGLYYNREKIKKSAIYEDILRSYYPNGIRIYDEQQMIGFRTLVIQKYGEIEMDSDRTIGTRIADCGILCGRGVYKPKQEHYLSNKLKNEIQDFIQTSESTILSFRYIYEQFEGELKQEGVDNQYYLQGILGELFRDRFGFKKDYISPEKEVPSLKEMIQKRIIHSKRPVSRAMLLSEFPGIKSFTVIAAADHPDIINYGGTYIYKGNIQISYHDKWRIRHVLKNLVYDHQMHHIREIYEFLIPDYRAVLRRNYVTDDFSCFSLLRYWFDEEFQFDRPYVTQFGVEIRRPMERLREYVDSRDEISFRELAEFAKENNVRDIAYLPFAEEHNDRFLLVSKQRMVAISKISVDEDLSRKVEELIHPYIHETMAIRELPCFASFPKIQVPWTDWLVYSILQKWGTKFSVGVSSNQLRLAVPLIAPKGQLDQTKKKYEVDDQEIFGTYDLNGLDGLQEEMIEWDELDTED